MLPYYIDLKNYFPYKTSELLSLDYKDIVPNNPKNNLFQKNTFDRGIINNTFRDDLESTIEATISKVNIWYWGKVKLNMAHIDCGKTLDEIHPFAINWVLNEEPSQVNWYDISYKDYRIKMGDEKVPGAEISNVTSYIPIGVKDLDPDHVWKDKDLVFLNTSIPHMIETDNFRISVSIQFPIEYKFQESLEKIIKKKPNVC
jgi:hypothetical protein